MRTYLEVSFEQKDKVKSLGAAWDMSRKQWYVPDGVDVVAFLKWVPNAPKLTKKVKKALKGFGRKRDTSPR